MPGLPEARLDSVGGRIVREAVEQAMAAAKDEHLWYEVPGPSRPRERRCMCGWTHDDGLGWLDAWELHVLKAVLDAALAAGCLLPETLEPLRSLVALAEKARYCEGLQSWYGGDPDDTYLDEFLDAIKSARVILRGAGTLEAGMGELTMPTVEEIKARWEAATPGPWTVIDRVADPENDGATSISYITGLDTSFPEGVIVEVLSGEWDDQPNAEAIACAPEDVAWLLSALETAETELAAALRCIDDGEALRARLADAREIIQSLLDGHDHHPRGADKLGAYCEACGDRWPCDESVAAAFLVGGVEDA